MNAPLTLTLPLALLTLTLLSLNPSQATCPPFTPPDNGANSCAAPVSAGETCEITCDEFYALEVTPHISGKHVGLASSFGRWPDGAAYSGGTVLAHYRIGAAFEGDAAWVQPALSGGAGTYLSYVYVDLERAVPYAITSAGPSLSGIALTSEAAAAGWTLSGTRATSPDGLLNGTAHSRGDMTCFQAWDGRFWFTKQLSAFACVPPACPPGADARPPRLVDSRVDAAGALEVRFAAADAALSVDFFFPDARAPAACAAAWSAPGSAVTACESLRVFSHPLPDALNDCGFEGPGDGGDFFVYEAVVESDTVRAAGQVFGTFYNRTTRAGYRLQVLVPREVAVNASGVVFGPVLEQARVTTQAANTTAVPAGFAWTLATSVQHPYELVASATAAASQGFGPANTLAVSGDDTCAGEAECTQRFVLSGVAAPDVCALDGSAALTFEVKCRDGYAGSCDLPVPASVGVSFSFATDDFCPQVVEVASVTPELTTYSDASGGVESSEFVLGTPLFGRVALAVEGGVRVSEVSLERLEIASPGGGVVVAAGLATFSSDPQTDGQPLVDFVFTLDTDAIQFPDGGTVGTTEVVLTAQVDVRYDTPDGQRRRRRKELQAVRVVGEKVVGVRAAGEEAEEAEGGGGVAVGVAAAAAAAVAVVVAAAAVAVRSSRRRTTTTKHGGESTLELSKDVLEVAPGTAGVVVDTGDLREVVEGYSGA